MKDNDADQLNIVNRNFTEIAPHMPPKFFLSSIPHWLSPKTQYTNIHREMMQWWADWIDG